MTDVEGCAGILNFNDWCAPGGRYYEKGKAILTGEVNAAVQGFFAGGATEVVVFDGHLGRASGVVLPLLTAVSDNTA